MFKYLRDFFKTLVMELGGVRVEEKPLGFSSSVLDLEIPSEDVHVIDETVNSEVLDALPGSSLKIESGDLSVSCKVLSDAMESQSEIFNGSFVEESAKVLPYDPKIDVQIKSGRTELPGVVIEKTEFSIKVEENTNLSQVWRMRIERKEKFEKDRILDALIRVLRRYRGKPEDLRFLGYFERVPLGIAEYVIFEGDDMVIKISKKPKRDVSVDLIAVRTPRGVVMEVVKGARGDSGRDSRGG